jgi:hypothetical protein
MTLPMIRQYPPDEHLPRIDVVVFDAGGGWTVLTGEPGPDPVMPESSPVALPGGGWAPRFAIMVPPRNAWSAPVEVRKTGPLRPTDPRVVLHLSNGEHVEASPDKLDEIADALRIVGGCLLGVVNTFTGRTEFIPSGHIVRVVLPEDREQTG